MTRWDPFAVGEERKEKKPQQVIDLKMRSEAIV